MKKKNLKIEEINITEQDRKRWETKACPLSYRVSIDVDPFIDETHFILKREYFFYNDGEKEDKFYVRDEIGSIFTRNFDPKHLQDIEKKLIEKFYVYLIDEEEKIKKAMKKIVKSYKKNIKKLRFYRTCEPFIKIQRKEKLERINENENSISITEFVKENTKDK